MLNNKLAKAVRLAIAFGGASTAVFAANANAAEEQAAEQVERIEVTGSRIKRTDMEGASPVTVMTAEEIKLSGYSRVEDILNQLPQIEAAETSFLANGATGTATLDLRGLGSNRTLVLVNGRRLQAGSITSQSPDVNQIPASLIKRVEVLTGGAAAVYGADAVAGVVNFIMNDDFEGLQMNVGASGYQHNNDNKYIQGLMDDKGFEYPSGSTGIDGRSYSIDLAIGGAFDGGKGNAVAYAVWRRNDELLQGTRDYSSCALNRTQSACGGSATTPNPHFDMYPIVDGEVDYTQNFFGYLNPNGNGFIEDDGYRYNYAPVNHFMRPNERFSFGTFVNYEINDNFRPYLEASFMHNRTAGQIAESGTFYNEEFVFDYDNPLISDLQKQQLQTWFGQTDADQFVGYIGKRNVEGGPRADNLEHSSYRIITGVEGEINDTWSYDVSYNYSATTSSSVYINDLLAPKIGPRVGAVGTECVEEDGCLYYNVFELGGVTPDQAAQLAGVGIQTGLVTQQILNGYVSGEIEQLHIPSAPAPVAAVFGFERREQTYERISDTVYAEGQLLGQGGPSASLNGEIDVTEFFTEFQVPVLDELNMNGALRWSDYSTSGSDTTFTVGADYTLADAYKFRASFAKAIRAPNVGELFSSQNIGLWTGDDPCAGTDPSYSLEQCQRTGMTAAQYGTGAVSKSPAGQYNQVSGGNTELNPEEADTITVGLVANPFEDFNFTIDYFDIKMENVIASVGAERILNNCATTGDAFFCDNVKRSPSGSLWLGQEGFVTNLSDNIGGRHWRGVDVTANYSMAVGEGTLDFNINGYYNIKKLVQPVLADSSLDYDCTGTISTDCFTTPKWRHTFQADYSMNDWRVTAKWRFYGEVDYDGTADTKLAEEGGVDAYNFFDVSGSYSINEHVTVIGGVNNILDEEPPMVGNSLSTNANTISGFYDSLGRFIHVSVNMTF
ncbi:Vitamin B12 transporter BtuB precursor [Pseudoalteromonas sp. P1-9]|uniref:TonB-dependent receptor domain-containing protein n=1 Tax=Pseudoalteromonas sp. P1-9 TaxID=1710354 RepID=UPI0006D5D544|nr:TonB-dependent receptor [Pseudoalteromonas sp. P1-9]KPV95558.1 Vitamin B12 transporter BtuB precursor [Pseudoalteromonas sp. P1-9]